MATKNKNNEIYEDNGDTNTCVSTDKNSINIKKNPIIKDNDKNSGNFNKYSQPQNVAGDSVFVKNKKSLQIISDVLIFSEEDTNHKKQDSISEFLKYQKRIHETNYKSTKPVDKKVFNEQLGTEGNLLQEKPGDKLGFTDVDGFFTSAHPNAHSSDESDGGYSGYEADTEDGPEDVIFDDHRDILEPPVLFYSYDLIIKKKKRFLYNNIIAVSTNFLLLNYINYLFYKHSWLLMYPDSIKFKLAARKYIFRLTKFKNTVYYSKKINFDVSGSRAVVQLTSRYRNKFFTFLRKNLHFNLSVGRVSFWKLKKTVYSRVLNFYNVFFRCIIPFLSRRFTILLYKLLRDWSGDLQKFNGAVLRAKRRRKIRRAYSIFKVIIFPKIIYGFMRSAKYPVRKRFLQRRALIK